MIKRFWLYLGTDTLYFADLQDCALVIYRGGGRIYSILDCLIVILLVIVVGDYIQYD